MHPLLLLVGSTYVGQIWHAGQAASNWGLCTCRVALGHIVDRSLALAEYLREGGPEAVHNMDNLLLRESMDVIGALRTFIMK